MGPEHPKTLRAKGVLRESRYRRIAIELGEWVDEDDAIQVIDALTIFIFLKGQPSSHFF